MRKQNRFERGSGCFKCQSCGKQTRNVDGNGDVGMCPLCNVKSMCENGLSDGGHDDPWGIFWKCNTEGEVWDLYSKEIAELQAVIS